MITIFSNFNGCFGRVCQNYWISFENSMLNTPNNGQITDFFFMRTLNQIFSKVLKISFLKLPSIFKTIEVSCV